MQNVCISNFCGINVRPACGGRLSGGPSGSCNNGAAAHTCTVHRYLVLCFCDPQCHLSQSHVTEQTVYVLFEARKLRGRCDLKPNQISGSCKNCAAAHTCTPHTSKIESLLVVATIVPQSTPARHTPQTKPKQIVVQLWCCRTHLLT